MSMQYHSQRAAAADHYHSLSASGLRAAAAAAASGCCSLPGEGAAAGWVGALPAESVVSAAGRRGRDGAHDCEPARRSSGDERLARPAHLREPRAVLGAVDPAPGENREGQPLALAACCRGRAHYYFACTRARKVLTSTVPPRLLAGAGPAEPPREPAGASPPRKAQLRPGPVPATTHRNAPGAAGT